MRKEISGGKAARKSILMRSRTVVEMRESWGKQHCVRIPWSMRFRCFEGAAEKSDQTCEMAS
jgi:hypothetical protein